MSGIKRKLDIEQLLQWAYRDELPKQFVGGNSLLADLAMLGAPIDGGDDGAGRMPIACGPPHPDALLLDYLVRGLPPVRVDLYKQRDYLMGHLSPYLNRDDPIVAGMATGPTVSFQQFHSGRGPKRTTREGKQLKVHARVRLQNKLVEPQAESGAALVTLHARLGNRPIWDLGPTRIVRNTKSLLGRQIKKNLYTEGSINTLRLEPPAQEIAAARFEYVVWHQALLALTELAKNMGEHIALPPAAPAAPWITGPEIERRSRVLSGGVHTPHSKLPLKPARPVVLPPLERGKNSDVTCVPAEEWKVLTTSDAEG